MKGKILITGIVLVLLTGCELFNKPVSYKDMDCPQIREELIDVRKQLDTVRWLYGRDRQSREKAQKNWRAYPQVKKTSGRKDSGIGKF